MCFLTSRLWSPRPVGTKNTNNEGTWRTMGNTSFYSLWVNRYLFVYLNEHLHHTMTCFLPECHSTRVRWTVFLWVVWLSTCIYRWSHLVWIIIQSACSGHFTLFFTSCWDRVGDNSPRASAIPHLAHHGSDMSLATTRPSLSTTGGGSWKQKCAW